MVVVCKISAGFCADVYFFLFVRYTFSYLFFFLVPLYHLYSWFVLLVDTTIRLFCLVWLLQL